MSKIKKVIEEYKKTYREVVGKEPPKVIQKGSWIVIDGKSIRSWQLEEATAMYQKKKPETLVDALIELDEPKPATATEILSSYDDVGMLAKAIHMKANGIRHTNKLSDAIKAGHDIVKLAKRIINLQGD